MCAVFSIPLPYHHLIDPTILSLTSASKTGLQFFPLGRGFQRNVLGRQIRLRLGIQVFLTPLGCSSEVSTFLLTNPSSRSSPTSRFGSRVSQTEVARSQPRAGTASYRDVTRRAVRRAAPPVRGSHCSAGRAGCSAAGQVLLLLSEFLLLLKARRGGPVPGSVPLRFSGESHHEQTESATGDSQRGNHRHAHR